MENNNPTPKRLVVQRVRKIIPQSSIKTRSQSASDKRISENRDNIESTFRQRSNSFASSSSNSSRIFSSTAVFGKSNKVLRTPPSASTINPSSSQKDSHSDFEAFFKAPYSDPESSDSEQGEQTLYFIPGKSKSPEQIRFENLRDKFEQNIIQTQQNLTENNIVIVKTENPEPITEPMVEPIIINQVPLQINMENITLQQALNLSTTENNPVVPKYTAPGYFDPTKNNDAVEFLKNFNQAAASNNWDSKFKLIHFGSYLRGHAAAWIKTVDGATTWPGVEKKFKEMFYPKNYDEDLKRALHNRRQQLGEDLRTYYFSKLELCFKVDPNMDAKDQKLFVEQGLLPQYRKQILLHRPKDLSELKELIDVYCAEENASLDSLDPISNLTKAIEKLSISQTDNRDQNYKRYNNFKMYNRGNYYGNNSNRGGFRNYNMGDFNRNNFRNQNNSNTGNYSGNNNYRGQNNSFNDNKKGNNDRPQIKNTRTYDGRPICYNCNRPGHIASACPNNQRGNQQSATNRGEPSRRNSGNGQGRR